MPTVDLDPARALKSKATAERNRGRFDRALQRLDEAIELLDSQLKPCSPESPEAVALRAEIADSMGMKGGVYRRLGKPAEALAAYGKGLALEDEAAMSTYNLLNVISLSLSVNQESPHSPLMRAHLDRAIRALEKDTLGPRRDEWWAWADLAQAYLLNGQPELAAKAHSEGRRHAGPSAEEVNRHTTLLEVLADSTSTIDQETALDLRRAAHELRG